MWTENTSKILGSIWTPRVYNDLWLCITANGCMLVISVLLLCDVPISFRLTTPRYMLPISLYPTIPASHFVIPTIHAAHFVTPRYMLPISLYPTIHAASFCYLNIHYAMHISLTWSQYPHASRYPAMHAASSRYPTILNWIELNCIRHFINAK